MVIRLPTSSHTVELGDKAAAAPWKPWNDTTRVRRIRCSDGRGSFFGGDPVSAVHSGEQRIGNFLVVVEF
jgi:hypothetical protein